MKIMLDDDTLPPLDELAARMRRAHAAGRPVAVHCVTRVQLVAATFIDGRLAYARNALPTARGTSRLS